MADTRRDPEEAELEAWCEIARQERCAVARQHREDVVPVYGALIQLGIHGQENKWWLLYIALTFNSILMLSCAALIAASKAQVLTCVLAGIGILVDLCWIAMAADYVRASNLYSDTIVRVERCLPEGFPRPLTDRKRQRAGKWFLGRIGFVAQAVPAVFIVAYGWIVALCWPCR